MRGLDGSVVHEKRARRFYGCVSSCLIPTIRDDDMEEHIYWNEPEDELRLEGEMTWFLKKAGIPQRASLQVIMLKYFSRMLLWVMRYQSHIPFIEPSP